MTLQTPAEGTIRLANAAYAPPPDYLAVSVLFRC
jgi:hypothetical protein